MGKRYLSSAQGGIGVEYTVLDERFVGETAAGLCEAVRMLREWFHMAAPLPVRAILTPDRHEYDRCVRDILKVEIEAPSHPARVAQPQRDCLVLLSPRAYEKPFAEYTPEAYRKLLLHEMTHIIEDRLSPDIEAVPRWWSEGLAMYLSQQWRDDKDTSRVLEGIGKRELPRIAEMEGDTAFSSRPVRLSYVWGWTIVMYVDLVHGSATVRRVVTLCSDGDIAGTIGQELPSFEGAWQGWLLEDGRRAILSPQADSAVEFRHGRRSGEP